MNLQPRHSTVFRALTAWVGSALVVSSTVALEGQSVTPRPIEVEDQFAIQTVGAPQLSPDGAWVAYTVTQTSLEKESSETRIWIAPVQGGEPIAMTARGSSAGSPQFSPDGRYLTFTASRGEGAKTQVWALDRRGGEANPLTSVPQGVRGYTWSPDGSRLALLVRDQDPETVDSTKPGLRIDPGPTSSTACSSNETA